MHNSENGVSHKLARLRCGLSLHPLARDFGLTSLTEFGVLVSGLAIVSLVGRLMGVAALGEYLLLRRVLAWLQPAEQLGTANALPRFVAYGMGGAESELRGYLGISLATSGGVAAVICLVLYAGRTEFGRWLYGSFTMDALILPLGLMAFGMTIHNCAYGYFRGRLDLIQANALQVFNVVVFPLVAVIALARTRSVPLILSVTGLVILSCSAAVCGSVLRRGASVSRGGLRAATRGLLGYGLPRVPGDFALGALLALGPLVAMRFIPVSQVTSLLLGISILSAVSAAATPVGTLMLSKVSMMLAQERQAEVRTHLRYLLAAVVALSGFVCLQLVVFTDSLLRLWVGQQFGGGTTVTRIIILAIPFYLIYCCLRGSVDAASITAYNTHNLLFSLGLFVVLLVAVVELVTPAFTLEGVAVALLLACVFLAWLTLRSMRMLLGLTMPWRLAAPGLLAGAVITGATLLAWRLIGPKLDAFRSLLLVVPASLAFALVMKATRSPWVTFFVNLAFRRNSPSQPEALTGPAAEVTPFAISEGSD